MFLFHSCIYWKLTLQGDSIAYGAQSNIFLWSQVSFNTLVVQWLKIVQLLLHDRRSEFKLTWSGIWDLESWDELGSIKLFLCCITAIVFVSESSRNHLGKVIKDVLGYAISNTGTESWSVEIPGNVKMPNIITKTIEDYCQCVLSKGHLYHIWLVAESKDSLLFLEKYFKRLR